MVKEEAELDLRTCTYLEYLCSTEVPNGRECGEVCRTLCLSNLVRLIQSS